MYRLVIPVSAGLVLWLGIIASPADAQVTGADASLTGISKAFNPALSVNGLFYGLASSLNNPEGEDLEPGLKVQEVEVKFSANVDVYLRGDVTLAMHGAEQVAVDVEELFLTTLTLPAGLQARFGRMNAPFGLHNRLHTHAFPFIDPPLINAAVFGPVDGFRDNGLEISWLAPMPWFLELRGAVYEGENELVFDAADQEDLAALGRIENLWDLGDSATLRLGGSYTWGHHPLPVGPAGIEAEVISQVWGGDAQLKWRPVDWKRRAAAVLQAEYLHHRMLDGVNWSEPLDGFYTHLLVQVSRRWWVQGRYDETWMHKNYWSLEGPVDKTQVDHRWSGAVAFVPSEFQAYKIGYEARDRAGEPEYRTWLQVNVTLGSHPAHAY
jgi:hypothetical protein